MSGEDCLPGLLMSTFSLCPHMALLRVCTHTQRGRGSSLLSPLGRTLTLLNEGPSL